MSSPAPEQFLHQLCFGPPPAKLLLVAAHPDDEVIGAGAQLPRWAKCIYLIHITDGAPANMRDAEEAGIGERARYARTRSLELNSAMALAGISRERLHPFGFFDQEASLHLGRAARLLARTFERLQPTVVLTHPYEGGHPDHDATAFVVHAACALRRRQQRDAPVILEMTSYFNSTGIMRTGEFLPCPGSSPTTLPLDPQQRSRKRALFDCFVTQQKVLQYFPIEAERFRLAPAYDFTCPPHPGRLYYELFDWGMTPDRWRHLATSAIEALGVERLMPAPATRPDSEVSTSKTSVGHRGFRMEHQRLHGGFV